MSIPKFKALKESEVKALPGGETFVGNLKRLIETPVLKPDSIDYASKYLAQWDQSLVGNGVELDGNGVNYCTFHPGNSNTAHSVKVLSFEAIKKLCDDILVIADVMKTHNEVFVPESAPVAMSPFKLS